MPASLRCGECGQVNEVHTDHRPHPDHAHHVYTALVDGEHRPQHDRVPIHVLTWDCPDCGHHNEEHQINHKLSVDDHNRRQHR